MPLVKIFKPFDTSRGLLGGRAPDRLLPRRDFAQTSAVHNKPTSLRADQPTHRGGNRNRNPVIGTKSSEGMKAAPFYRWFYTGRWNTSTLPIHPCPYRHLCQSRGDCDA